MKATEAKLLDFLKKSPQFVIPIYQRTYSWTERECRQLWDDILRTGSNDTIAAHFVGSIVYIEKGLYQVSSQSPLLVIDGQQRLTTVMLLLEALARHVGDGDVRAVYEAFKAHTRSPEVATKGVDAVVADIHAYAGYYCAMALDKESDKNLASAFRDLRELKVDVAFPFLLELYRDHVTNHFSKEDLVRAVRLVEAYVFRRAVCAIPTNSLNKTFATLGRALKKDRYLESIHAHCSIGFRRGSGSGGTSTAA